MRKNLFIKVGVIILMIITPIITAVPFDTELQKMTSKNKQTTSFSITFTKPYISKTDESNNIIIEITEATTQMINNKGYLLPCYTKVFTFPLGTEIIDVKCTHTPSKSIPLEERMQKEKDISNSLFYNKQKNGIHYSNEPYEWKTGGGIQNGQHVMFVVVTCYPLSYKEYEQQLSFIAHFDVTIEYQQQSCLTLENDDYDFLILSPSTFQSNLEPLVNHKNSNGIKTKLITIQDINSNTYFTTDGRDVAENIKLFLFEAFSQWGIDYVLLVGDIKKLPIRTTYMGTGDYERTVLTDLYYADLCFGDGSFCSWDSNNNGIYGEQWHGGTDDIIDLYPDLNIGRLACSTVKEVDIVVNKIISYEENQFGSAWADTIVLAGGDTHPSHNHIIEGELLIDEIQKVTTDFNHVILKTSEETFSAQSINNALNQGAGLVCYAGHGFEIGLSTHPPYSEEWIDYTLLDLMTLENQGKYPIVYFNACLTARLDYNIANLIADLIYFTLPLPKLDKRDDITFPVLFPCIAWKMITKQNGGAIATIGATRIAYGMIDDTGEIKWGCGFLTLNFFKSIANGQYLSESHVYSQNEFLNNATWKDPFTLQEFILLGDPTLKVGGYE